MNQIFDYSDLSAILIQMKNQVKSMNIFTSVVKLKNYFKFFSYIKNPILYIPINLETSKTDFEILNLTKSEDMQQYLSVYTHWE